MHLISNDRVIERSEWMWQEGGNEFARCSAFYPALRYGLYQFFDRIKPKRVLCPHYCPEGIRDPFSQLGCDIRYYDVQANTDLVENFKIPDDTDVFVYIHYYGLYNARNIDRIKQQIPDGCLFVEDFAHTIYTGNGAVGLSGDLCTFSFTKIFGVPQGSCILFPKTNGGEFYYTKKTLVDYRIEYALKLALWKRTYVKNRYFSKLCGLFLYGMGLYDYYPIMMSVYTKRHPAIDDYSKRILRQLDMEKIDRKRKELAEIYLSELSPSLLISGNRDIYSRQSLFAFPIQTRNNERFAQALQTQGVRALMLKTRWWFGGNGDKDLYDTHVLLPINHHLSVEDIRKIVRVVNGIDAKM